MEKQNCHIPLTPFNNLCRHAIGSTFIAPNIATIKYWGKLEQKYNIPLNGSLSVTLDRNSIRSSTKITLYEPDIVTEELLLIDNISFVLNGKQEPILKKHKTGLEYFLDRGLDIQLENGGSVEASEYKKWCMIIESDNNFPTAAGMASSASGLACFTLALCDLFGYFDYTLSQVTKPDTETIDSQTTDMSMEIE
jgi:diphosphomevalonate decarboxylase